MKSLALFICLLSAPAFAGADSGFGHGGVMMFRLPLTRLAKPKLPVLRKPEIKLPEPPALAKKAKR